MSKSPLKPWKTGRHPQYTACRLTVTLCLDEHGNVWSEHDFASPADKATCGTMPQGGIPHVAHALLTEALRREAFQVALIQMTKDPDFIHRWMNAGEDERATMAVDLGHATAHVISQAMTKMVPGAVEGVLEMLSAQMQGPTTGR